MLFPEQKIPHSLLKCTKLSRLCLSSKFPPGHVGPWQTWIWCHMTCTNPLKLLWKFHPNPTSGTLSRLYLSSKSLPGVLEDMEVPDEPGDGVIWLVSTFRSFCKSFIMIKHDVLVVFQKGGNNWPFWTKN